MFPWFKKLLSKDDTNNTSLFFLFILPKLLTNKEIPIPINVDKTRFVAKSHIVIPPFLIDIVTLRYVKQDINTAGCCFNVTAITINGIIPILTIVNSNNLYKTKEKPGKYKSIKGIENIDKVIDISQAPIGRTPRSNPVTYTGVFSAIRDLFASTPEAKAKGYNVVWGPVVDMASKGAVCRNSRCLSDDINTVCDYALAMIKGYQDEGMIVSAKHFLNPPDILDDTHMKEGVSSMSENELLEIVAKPYERAIKEAGLTGVMTGHFVLKNIDDKYMIKKCLKLYLKTFLYS